MAGVLLHQPVHRSRILPCHLGIFPATSGQILVYVDLTGAAFLMELIVCYLLDEEVMVVLCNK